MLSILICYVHAEVAGVRFDRLKKAYEDPMTEVFLLFYQASLQPFISMNKFLQRDDPLIPIMADQMNNFLKKLFGQFVILCLHRESTARRGTARYGLARLWPAFTQINDDLVILQL